MGLEEFSFPAFGLACAGDAAGARSLLARAAADDARAPSPNREQAYDVTLAICDARQGHRAAAVTRLGETAAEVDAEPLWRGEDGPPNYWEIHWTVLLAAHLLALELGLAEAAAIFALALAAMVAELLAGLLRTQAREFTAAEIEYEGTPRPLIASGPRSGPRYAVALAGIRGYTKAVENSGPRKGQRVAWSHLRDEARGTMLEWLAGESITRKGSGLATLLSDLERTFGRDPRGFLSPTKLASFRAFIAAPDSISALLPLAAAIHAKPGSWPRLWARSPGRVLSLLLRSGKESTAPLQFQSLDGDGTLVSASAESGLRESPQTPALEVIPASAALVRIGDHLIAQLRNEEGRFPIDVDVSRFLPLASILHHDPAGPRTWIELGDGSIFWEAGAGAPTPPAPPAPTPSPGAGGALRVTAEPMSDGRFLIRANRADARLEEIWPDGPEIPGGSPRRWIVST